MIQFQKLNCVFNKMVDIQILAQHQVCKIEETSLIQQHENETANFSIFLR